MCRTNWQSASNSAGPYICICATLKLDCMGNHHHCPPSIMWYIMQHTVHHSMLIPSCVKLPLRLGCQLSHGCSTESAPASADRSAASVPMSVLQHSATQHSVARHEFAWCCKAWWQKTLCGTRHHSTYMSEYIFGVTDSRFLCRHTRIHLSQHKSITAVSQQIST